MAKVSATTKNALMERLKKNSTIDDTDTLTESKVFNRKDFIHSGIPMLDVAFSGDIDEGFKPGVLMIAGPSKHFKTGFALVAVAAFLRKYEDGIVLFYDSEFGAPQSYFSAHGIDPERVLHTPIMNIEELKHDIVVQLDTLTDKDHVMIMVDSIGNLASNKEIEDAMKGEVKVDMTRAKALKSLFRMITPMLTIKNIPFVAINHSYQTLEMYSKTVMGGGTGSYYGANDVWILGRQQDKDGKELNGYDFVIRIDKSRSVKEGSKIPIKVTFEDGIHRWSGLFDLAVEFGIITSEKQGWYQIPGKEAAVRRADVEDDGAFWAKVFKDTDMKTKVRDKYKLVTDKAILGENVDEDGVVT